MNKQKKEKKFPAGRQIKKIEIKNLSEKKQDELSDKKLGNYSKNTSSVILTELFLAKNFRFSPGLKPLVIFLPFLRNFFCYLHFMNIDIVGRI